MPPQYTAWTMRLRWRMREQPKLPRGNGKCTRQCNGIASVRAAFPSTTHDKFVHSCMVHIPSIYSDLHVARRVPDFVQLGLLPIY